MDKLHVPKRKLDSVNSRPHLKLGNTALTSLCHIQKAQLELVELNIKHGRARLNTLKHTKNQVKQHQIICADPTVTAGVSLATIE